VIKKYYRYISVKMIPLCSQVTDEPMVKLIPVDKDLFIALGTSTYFKFSQNYDQSVSLTIFDKPVQYGPSELNLRHLNPYEIMKRNRTIKIYFNNI